MQNHLLTILILLPVVGAATAIVYSLTPGARESHHRWIALGFTTLSFLVSLLLVSGSGSALGAFRFEENYPWIAAIGARYHLGVDGISLWLVVLTTLLMPIAVLSSWTAVTKRPDDLLRADAPARIRDDWCLCLTRSPAVLSVLRSVSGPDVFPDRDLGW
jgi:NADH-quinone oxidoreductase subunit M